MNQGSSADDLISLWYSQICRSMLRSPENQSDVNRIMRRFRPIAPKPAAGEPSSGLWKRTKRKYVRIRGRRGRQSESTKPPPPEKSAVEDETRPEKVSVTLQLLPDRSEESLNSSDLRTGGVRLQTEEVASVGRTLGIRTAGSVVETSIIVARVTDAFSTDQVWLGFSDREKMCSLESDTCPGFISDPTNNVIWVNEAYRKMVAAGERGFVVRLVVKDMLPHICPWFACRVRVVQRGGQGQNWNKIVPCDVWRMESAGFAWKLDVNTALSLGI